MRIRPEQMRVFAKSARETFLRRQAARLRSSFPVETETLETADLESLVEDAFDRARSYGVINQQDVELFLDCTMMLAQDFDTNPRFPWASRSLNRAKLTGTEKMSLIHDHLLFPGA